MAAIRKSDGLQPFDLHQEVMVHCLKFCLVAWWTRCFGLNGKIASGCTPKKLSMIFR